jgi:hypothetical protein
VRSFEHSPKSDLSVGVDSSQVVTPAAEMHKEAIMAGAGRVIINQGETPLDSYARLRF